MENFREHDCKKHLKYDFSDMELQELGQDLASKHNELDELEEALNAIKAEYKDKITRVESVISSLVRKVNSKSEYRDIDCIMAWDYNAAIYTVTRKDTMETVEERALTDDERQMKIDEGDRSEGHETLTKAGHAALTDPAEA